jgi:3-isopropylmalate dehydratase
MPGIVKQPQTLYDKVFNDHIVDEKDDGTILLYIGNQYYLRLAYCY